MAYGYYSICVNDEGKSKRTYIDHLVLQEFIKSLYSGYVNGDYATNTRGFGVPKGYAIPNYTFK